MLIMDCHGGKINKLYTNGGYVQFHLMLYDVV